MNRKDETMNMKTTNVVSIKAARNLKQAAVADESKYEVKISKLDKMELLTEMVDFQDERSRTGYLTPQMMVRGKILFRALEETAETEALQSLTRSYQRHLEYELQDYLATGEIARD